MPTLDIFAIAGEAEHESLASKLAAHALGTTESDWIVTLDAALPTFVPDDQRHTTNCNHFDYFDEDTQVSSLRKAEAYLRSKLSTDHTEATMRR
jgi:hypothetical protein